LNRYSDAAKKDTKKDRAKGMRKARNIRTQRANKGLWGSDIGEALQKFEGLAVKSGNESGGYYDRSFHVKNGKNEVKTKADYKNTHAAIKKMTGAKDNQVRDYLDSKRGRHLVGNESDRAYVTKDFAKFSKTYNASDYRFESVEEGLNHDRYLRSHGKKAKGHGRWSFTTMRTGTPNEKDVLTATGKLGDVANIAQRNFKGKDIYVMESVEQTDEAYTVAQRIKAKQRMKKMSKRIQMAKKRAMKRAPSTEKLKLRARKQAKGALVAKWSKGKQKGELSFAQRQNIEKRLKSASGRIDTMSKRLLPDVRKQDRERRSNAKNKSEEK